MTRRERLLACLQGRPVDRLPINFYEVGGFVVNPDDPNPFNIYNDPSWKPLLQLAEEHTDLLRMCEPGLKPAHPDVHERFFRTERYLENGSRFNRITLTASGKNLTELSRRDPDIDTLWVLEHLLKSEDDVQAYLELPDQALLQAVDCHGIHEIDRKLGDKGLAMINTGDPVCAAAHLLGMQDFLLLAMTNEPMTHRLLEKIAGYIYPIIEQTARECPGFLWRVFGAEYATEPYLPPHLFEEYVVRYTQPIVDIIHRHQGLVRLHCHGRLRSALPFIRKMGLDALDPIEPPPQGDVQLAEVRSEYGADLTLFGNLEACDIENMEPSRFEQVVAQSIAEGTSGQGRGFVLMPSASPYGRTITTKTMTNYETMVRLAGRG